jgi:hypothetical protein
MPRANAKRGRVLEHDPEKRKPFSDKIMRNEESSP